MTETAKTETPEMRYLLGALSKEEETRVEEGFFADDSKFEAVELAEDELIDAYVRGELSAEQLQQFKMKLGASPRLIERVHFALALAERASELAALEGEALVQAIPVPAARVGWWEGWVNLRSGPRLALAACVLLLLVGGAWLIANWFHLRSESNRIVVERAAIQRQKEELEKQLGEQQTKTAQLTADLQRVKDQRTEDFKKFEEWQRANMPEETQARQSLLSTLATAFLTPGLSRSGGGQSDLIIPSGTITARLQLALEKNDYPTYKAVITTADGTVVTRKTGLKAHNGGSGPQLLLFIPARNLSADNYLVHVDGVTATGQVEDVNDYAFRVPKK